MMQSVSGSIDKDYCGDVHYTAGSLEFPTPKVISMLKRNYPMGRSFGLELKQDILSTLQFINEQRSMWKKMGRAAIRMATTMSASSTDEVSGLYHRWIEIGMKCHIQQMKRISLKYNSELQRSYMHGTVDNTNIKRKLMRPEHFERGIPHNKKKQSHNAAPLVNKQRGIVSPWEGSEFKYEILCSLRAKLLKKLVLSAFKCYARMCQNNRQCITSAVRSNLKRLMQLCFSSILLEALSAKYIVFASNNSARKLLASKYLRPALRKLQLTVLQKQRNRVLDKQSEVLRRRTMRQSGFRLLRWNVDYSESHRLLARWAAQHTHKHGTLRAFTAWVASFIKKNKLREQIHARLSETINTPLADNSMHSDSMSTTARNTTINGAPLHASFTSLHPSVVLDQSPLANLRAAVSFFVGQSMSQGGGDGSHGKHSLNYSGLSSPGVTFRSGNKSHFSDAGRIENNPDNGTYLSRSCQKTLSTHTRRSLRELRVAQLESEALKALNTSSVSTGVETRHNASSAMQNKGRFGTPGTPGVFRSTNKTAATSCSLHRTAAEGECSGTQEGLLQADVRAQLQSSLRARSLFPQSRFALSSSASEGSPVSNSSDSGGSGGRDGSGRNRVDVPGHSRAWRNRHATRDGQSGYVLNSAEDSPGFSLSSEDQGDSASDGEGGGEGAQEGEYSSIEDLLLNVTPGSRPASRSAPHSGAHKGTTASSVRHHSARSSRTETSLLDKAIHESFVLSSPMRSGTAPDSPLTPGVLTARDRGADSAGPILQQGGSRASTTSGVPAAYFGQVRSSGGFCGEVEVDSDLDEMISESSKHRDGERTKTSRSVAVSVNAGNQRILVHRQFMEQIQGAFQMIKFRWLIRSCRRFVRTLHQLTKRHKTAYQCSKAHNRGTRRRCWAAWKAAFNKQLAAGILCDRIHCLKLGRRVLKEWRRQSIDRLLPASTQCYALARRTMCKNNFAKWRGFFQQRRYQLGIDRVLQRSKKMRVFGHWRIYIGLLKQSKAIFYKMSKRVLRPIFQKWRKKYNQRTLLHRVFTVHDDAWRWRSYSTPSPFQRLYSVLTAWKVYTQQSLHQRHVMALQTRAMYFRGASLLAAHFHRWIDYLASQRQERRLQRVHQQATRGRYFHAWAGAVHCQQQQVSALRHRVTVRSPLRRVLYGWFRVSLGHAVYGPRRHHAKSLLQRAFDYLKTQRPLRRMVQAVLPLCDRTRVKASFRGWADFLARRSSYRRGLHTLNKAWLRLKLRLAFLTWPGRRQSLLARQMSDYLANKHRARIRLVECSEETKVVEVVSFVAKRRPTFAQRAVTRRYIDNVADLQGLHYYQDLCKTILQVWGAYITKFVATRLRSFAVRNALQCRNLRRTMMHWVLVTPKTSYRRVVWMVRPPRKAHDDYAHKRELDREFGVQLAKSKRELRYGKNALPGNTKEPHTEDGEYYTDEDEGEYVVQKKVVKS